MMVHRPRGGFSDRWNSLDTTPWTASTATHCLSRFPLGSWETPRWFQKSMISRDPSRHRDVCAFKFINFHWKQTLICYTIVRSCGCTELLDWLWWLNTDIWQSQKCVSHVLKADKSQARQVITCSSPKVMQFLEQSKVENIFRLSVVSTVEWLRGSVQGHGWHLVLS